MPAEQGLLAFTPVRNLGLFSNHWLANRFQREPEWEELKDAAFQSLQGMAELWNVQRDRVERYGDEQGLEEGFIQPVLRFLGWKLKYQSFLAGREPDYSLFLDDYSLDAALRTERTAPEFWVHPVALADAKAWHVALDRPSRIGSRREYPPEQIEWYLDRSRLSHALLTNGRLWRLIPREHGPQQRRFQTFLEFDLPALLNEWVQTPDLNQQVLLLEDFLYFFLFFGPAAFREIHGRKPLIQRAAEGSSEYRVGVGEGLKERTFEALRLCIEGFLNFPPNSLHGSFDLAHCRDQSFIFLYRLLFIMFAEDRGLLPYKINRLYSNNRSLGRHRDQIAGRLNRIADGREEDYSKESTALWHDLLDLFDLVDRGHRNYGVAAYNGGLFDPEANPFLVEKQLPDWYLARVIDQLGRAQDPQLTDAEFFRVDYHDLAIQHLGSIYEGLLELHPRWANERMIVVSRQANARTEERYIRASETVPPGFTKTDREYPPKSIYLQTDKGERRETGSYYTPDHIVDYIVENTLDPLCRSISEQLEREIKAARVEGRNADAERLEGEFDRRLLGLRILDPAMGSGHFLLRACQYLAEAIATNPYTREPSAIKEGSEAAMAYWKRQVVEKCLYGVDMNSLAVELAKLALWLETVAEEKPLSFLDHHLREGNSLVGARISRMGALPGAGELATLMFADKVRDSMPGLLSILDQIRNKPSEESDQIKEKEQVFRRFLKSREPFRQLADLWCSKFAEPNQPMLTQEQYHSALEVVGNPHKFNKLALEPWFKDALERARRPDMRCFSWELEFPEAFFVGQDRRPSPGFDAVIGNPPYDVLSELENDTDLTAFRKVIAAEPSFEPSERGKNNLYKLFLCRALDLVAEGGYLGFITPMALLGDDQAADLRRQILKVGCFRAIEAFPQKDKPSERVFPEAKLSTVVFSLQKDKSPESRQRPFRSRVHRGRFIEENSPTLTLSTASIPLYDPSNFTIVSCDQEDWDLATRMMASGRMARLKEFAEFFQGEVNETNERARGNLTKGARDGKLVTRGASICSYVLRTASQGNDIWLNVESFLGDKNPISKAFHYKYPRVGLQESSPQNNFRRIIAAFVSENEFTNHTVNYCPEHKSKMDLNILLALLNSKLADWYFRLGSTNAHVSHYQIYNLPYPVFSNQSNELEGRLETAAAKALRSGDAAWVLDLLKPLLADAPFSLVLRKIIIEAVKQIVTIETARGDIPRAKRSALDPAAQPFQDLIDQMLFRMAGFSDPEIITLEKRYARML